VGDKVAAAMGYVLPDWSGALTPIGEDQWRLDLSAANAQQLDAEGVTQIGFAELCTACNQHEFYSHRAGNGRTGRFAVAAYLEPGHAPERITVESDSQDRRQELREDRASTLPDSLNPPGFPALGERWEE
jgi:hypothetical protein